MWKVCGRMAQVHKGERGGRSAASVGEMCLPHAEIWSRAWEEEEEEECVWVSKKPPPYILNKESLLQIKLHSYSAHMELWAYRATFNTSRLSLWQIWSMSKLDCNFNEMSLTEHTGAVLSLALSAPQKSRQIKSFDLSLCPWVSVGVDESHTCICTITVTHSGRDGNAQNEHPSFFICFIVISNRFWSSYVIGFTVSDRNQWSISACFSVLFWFYGLLWKQYTSSINNLNRLFFYI